MSHYGNAWRLKAGPWADPSEIKSYLNIIHKIAVCTGIMNSSPLWLCLTHSSDTYTDICVCSTEVYFKTGWGKLIATQIKNRAEMSWNSIEMYLSWLSGYLKLQELDSLDNMPFCFRACSVNNYRLKLINAMISLQIIVFCPFPAALLCTLEEFFFFFQRMLMGTAFHTFFWKTSHFIFKSLKRRAEKAWK